MEASELENNSELQVFKRQVLQLVPFKELQWPDGATLRTLNAQDYLYHQLFDNGETNYLAPARYQVQILKELLSKIESNIEDPDQDEISENLTNALVSFLNAPMPTELATIQRRSYVTYSFPTVSQKAKVTLLESRSVISSAGTTGLRTWEASLHLASFLSSPQGMEFVTRKRVLELGSGTGLASILCSKYFNPELVFATDGSQDIVDALDDNFFLNGLQNHSSAHTRLLRWGTAIEPGENGEVQAFDTILGADITYDPKDFPSLLWTFREFLALNSKSQILVAATIRNEETFPTFLDQCIKAEFSTETLPFEIPTVKEQIGPFYSSSVPIHIVKITGSHMKQRDPFAV